MLLKKEYRLGVTALVLSLLVAACGYSTTSKSDTTALTCAPIAHKSDLQFSAKMDQKLASAVERGFAGGVTVMRDGVVIYSRTVGSASLTEDIPVTSETLFHVASITKYFTAALILKAVEEGKFSLTDSVASFLPGTEVATRGVTFADLLSHQSGLGSSYAAESETVREQAVAEIDKASYDPEKVGQFRYSNDGFDLLGIILERIYETSYENLLPEKIYTPACLKHASHWGLVDVADPHTVSQPLRSLSPELRNRNYGMISSAGLLITAEDLAAYQNVLASGQILDPSSLEEMFAPRGAMSIGQATFGAFLGEHPALGRKLNARGYEDWGDNAILIHYLDHDIIVAVVTSRGPSEETDAPPFRSELSGAVEAILADATGVAN